MPAQSTSPCHVWKDLDSRLQPDNTLTIQPSRASAWIAAVAAFRSKVTPRGLTRDLPTSKHACLGQAPMLDLDIQSCPFPLLYRGNESDEPDPDAVDTKFSKGDGWNFPGEDNLPLDMKLEDLELARHPRAKSLGALTDPNLVAVGACENISGTLLQPAAYATASDLLPAPAEVAAALKAAPTALLLAHLTLREAIAEAEDLLATSNATNLSEAVEPQKP
ncbi:unnamed protein product [Effrenium voratum]|nr:unnamed protein product [Effrenium voratum]